MKPIGIVTDSNSGYAVDEKIEDVFVLPMPFIIDEKEFVEGEDLSVEDFYKYLEEGKCISTAQPPVASMYRCYTEVLEDYERIIHFPMSSGLSNTYQTSQILANHFPGRVSVVDAKRISTPLKREIQDVLKLVEEGKTIDEILEILKDYEGTMDIYLALDTLEYIQAGGRGSKALMKLGTFLRIKPVVYLGSGKAELYKNVKTANQSKEVLITAAEDFFKEHDRKDYYLDIGHTRNEEAAYELKKELIKRLDWKEEILIDELSLSIGTHTGPGALAIGISKKIE